MRKTKQEKGITLIVLVITIIILLILAGVTIITLTGENGILRKSQTASEETNKQTATEIMKLKITNIQMETYSQKQQLPNLQDLANGLCQDEADEIEYVFTESRHKQANLEKIEVGEAKSIFTKLREYPYEFEIDSFLRVAFIDGIKEDEKDENDENNVTIGKEEYENLKSENIRLTQENENLKSENARLTQENENLKSENTRLKQEYENLRKNTIKPLGSFVWWKEGATWNETGFSGNVCYDEKMCEVVNNTVKIKEARKIFNFNVFF